MTSPVQNLQDFDLRLRGAVELSEKWKANRDEVREIWSLEDIVESYNALFTRGFEIFDSYCQTGKLPNPALSFSYLADTTRRISDSARGLMIYLNSEVPKGVATGIAELESNIQRANEILDEDSFATEMALHQLKESN